MSNPIWPVSLPQIPLQEGYQERVGPNTIRTQMEQGPSKRRRRYTVSHDPHRMTFELEGADLATFKTFYKSTLLHGALSFDMTHPQELVTATFHFAEEPAYSNVGGDIYHVSCSLERTA